MPEDTMTPISLIREAIKAVPAVKWALGVGGILATVSLVYTFKIDPRAAFVGIIVMFVFMGVLVLFARASTLKGRATVWPAVILTWFLLIMFMVTSMSLFTSVFLSKPLDLQRWLTGEKRNTDSVVLPKPIPIIPNADSDWVDGGSSPDMYCNPQLAAVRQKYLDFNIAMQIPPEGHKTEYTPFKHDLYRYYCSFVATPR